LSKYRKFLVVVVGILVGLAGRRYGIDSQAYIDIVAVATAAGVYAVPNQ
jgi:hypothetical protein